MKTVKISLFILVVCFAGLGFQCNSGGNTSDPSRGFDVAALVRFLRQGGGGFDRPAQAQNVGGVFQGATSATTIGFRANFSIPTMFNVANVRDAKVPANWLVQGFIFDLNCNGLRSNQRDVGIGGTIKLICETVTPSATITPESIDANAPPSNISIFTDGSNAIDTTFGMPKIAIYDELGNLKNVSVTYSGKGGSLKINTPNLTNFQNGNYTFIINNVKADGSWDVIAIGNIFIFGNPPPDPPDPCLNERPDC
jgi:hypothetical protein